MAGFQSTTADAIFKAFREDRMFPEALSNSLNAEDAYRAQMRLLELRCNAGEVHAGWKVGLTSKAMQEQQGVHEPCLGHLLRSGHLQSPARMNFAALMSPGFENELCLRIKSPLQGTVTFEQAESTIGAVAPAIEVIEKRGHFGADFPLAIAGNVQQCAFVTGPFVEFSPDVDLASVTLDLCVNGVHVERGTGTAVLENPINSVVWVADKLGQFGCSLKPGDLIMSGSFTRQYAASPSDRVVADFGSIGAVELTFG